jgi:hypothetical protein
LCKGLTELPFQDEGKDEEEMEEFRIDDSGREIMDLEVFRGKAGMLSSPEADVDLSEPRAFSHHSGVVGDNDRVVHGGYEHEGCGSEVLDELMDVKWSLRELAMAV